MNLLTSAFHPISKETSLYIKGGAIILMLIAHLVPYAHIEFHSIRIFTGTSCLAFYALISGYAHSLLANKYKDINAIQIAIKCYRKFYIYYILCCAIVIPVYIIEGKISASNIPLIIIPIYCSRMVDPWWYAFCYGVFCFILFPIIRWLENIINNSFFAVALFLCIIATIILPLSFGLPFFHDDFKQMWNSIPILRTIMIIPYYMIGFGYYKYIQNPERNLLLLTLLGISLLVFTFFPFSAYKIDGISAINIGFSFILCSIALCILHRSVKTRRVFEFIGTHSTFMWLLHTPIALWYRYVVIHYVPFSVNHGHTVIKFLSVFSLSLSVSMLITYIQEKIHAIYIKTS